ncbi:MAG: aminotransferase class IV [Desulfovibrionaceae bacterium]
MIYYWKGGFHEDRVGLAVAGEAFRFGCGFFSTLLYDGGVLHRPGAHVARLAASLTAHAVPFVRLDAAGLEAVAAQVLSRNGLAGSTARVNVYYPIEGAGLGAPASPGALAAMGATGATAAPVVPAASIVPAAPLIAAYAYTPPPADKVFSLAVSRGRYASPAHEHKSMSRMHLWQEQRWAEEAGFDQALLLAPDGRILETTTSAFLVSDGNRYYTPRPQHRLPSTAVAALAETHPVVERDIMLSDLPSYSQAVIANALIGLRAVGRVEKIG